jgi:hypothetical protein
MIPDPIAKSQGSSGFLSPFGDHRIGAQGDLSGFFLLVEHVDEALPVIRGDLWRGYVGPERLDALEGDFATMAAGLTKMKLAAGDLAGLGFTSDYLHRVNAVTPEAVCARPLAALAACIAEARSELEVFPDHPNHAIRTGSTAIPDSMLIRDLPREAFFQDGPPLWRSY